MVEKDYSGTPLWKKLGIREESRVVVSGAPRGFAAALGKLPAGVSLSSRLTGRADVIVLFATKRATFDQKLASAVRALEFDGGLWLCWPKRASKVETDLTFDVVQRLGLDAGLVDNKTASIDDVFQGMRLVYRLKDRPAKTKETPARRG
jgi:hypothetical protein